MLKGTLERSLSWNNNIKAANKKKIKIGFIRLMVEPNFELANKVPDSWDWQKKGVSCPTVQLSAFNMDLAPSSYVCEALE